MEDKKFDEALKEVITSLLTQAEEERLKDPKYQDLFKKSTDYGSLLRETEHNMNSAILDSCEVLKEKFGVNKIDNNTWEFFLALPILEHLIQKSIEEKEGRSCCVDKTYYILSNLLKKKLGEIK